MEPIDLLSLPGEAAGARPGRGGFTVDVPWGEWRPSEVALNEGWYEFRADGSGTVLILHDRSRYNLIELEARRSAPAYVRLSGGLYDVSLLPGARPGFYPCGLLQIRPLAAVERARLLTGRLVQALRTGVSWARIRTLIHLALSNRTYGLRAAGVDASPGVGVLSAAGRMRDLGDIELGEYARRLMSVSEGPIFLVRGMAGAAPNSDRLNTQVYGRFTLDPREPHDFVLIQADGEVLTPDALLLFAEEIVRRPQADVVVADTWVDGVPTARVAWDPLLYTGGIPTPFVHRRDVPPRATFANEGRFSIVEVPLAASSEAWAYADYAIAVPADRPACSIIIPTRDRADLLAACLEGLFDNTPWPHEVIVVDNGSTEAETFALFEQYAERGLKIVRADIPFNFSTLCNLGVEAAVHDYLVFLNNDVVLYRPDWLERMIAIAVQPWAGAVGARLLYADGRLQHGGVMLGLTQLCGHLWRGMPRAAQDVEPRLRHNSLRSAVTAASLCVSRQKFESVGGYDSEHFPVTLNDVDLCLKLMDKGWFNIYCATAEAYHLEGESRGEDDQPEKIRRRRQELRAFAERAWKWVRNDRFLPSCASRAQEIFRLR